MEIPEKLSHEKIYVALNKFEILDIMLHTKLGIVSIFIVCNVYNHPLSKSNSL